MKKNKQDLIRSAEDLQLYSNKLRKKIKLNYYEELDNNDNLIKLQYETKSTPFVV